MKYFALLVAAGLMLPGVAPAASDGFDGPVAEARKEHDRGVGGDAEAVLRAIELLQKRLETEPDDQLARVYLGSAYTLRSRDMRMGPGRLEALRTGGRLMDEAVAAAPDDARVRLVRAVNHINLPAIFNRRQSAREDFVYLLGRVGGDECDLNEAERQAVYYFAGLSFRQMGQREQAREAWEQGLTLNAELSEEIRKELESL